jgi:hypothetical protein
MMKRILAVLSPVVPVVIVLACSQSATQAVFTDAETACQAIVLATSVIPPGTPASTVAGDVQIACDLAESLLPDIEKVVVAFEAGSDAGSVTAYVPSPLAVKARSAKQTRINPLWIEASVPVAK